MPIALSIIVAVGLAAVAPAAAQDEPSASPAPAGPSASASASVSPSASPSPSPLDLRPEGSWVATAYDTWGDGLLTPRPGSTLTVSLLPVGRLEGRTGCGSYFGGHTVEGDSIRLGVLTSETGDCPPRLADEAYGFTQALSIVSGWVPSATGLQLLDAEGRVRVTLERPRAIGPVGDWLVRRYTRPNGALVEPEAGLQAGLEAGLLLAEDGSATGSTGCRGVHGTYTVEADRIVIAPLTVIGLPCQGAAQRQDRRLRALLDETVRWRRAADTLLLTDAEGGILLELQERPIPEASASPVANPPGGSPRPSAAPAD